MLTMKSIPSPTPGFKEREPLSIFLMIALGQKSCPMHNGCFSAQAYEAESLHLFKIYTAPQFGARVYSTGMGGVVQ